MRNKRLFCIFSSVLSVVSGAFSIVAICFWMVRYVFDFENTHKELKAETLTGTFGVWGADFNEQKLEPVIYAALVFAILLIVNGVLIWWSSRTYLTQKSLEKATERNYQSNENFRNPAYIPSSFDNNDL
ncbi:Oidioi.mRNA.OKI2018_I69.PAR.g10257.t1.cds [Oikopleura dioica]|uniref:Oidioi.mRNA.OKI2018_I69.PAR.g10257.t1.cds n=1 Tax=Oikopleura dioica TaxID=34765 RepID=A0ABN7RU37_OIKDI|nr:Oidioi.mRNA.OKI2018_I69.PAR.g10257.t1.cds [Oikopleura dioica]